MSWIWYADVGNCTVHWAAQAEGLWQAADRLPVELLESGAGEETVLALLAEAGLEPVDCVQAVLCVSAAARRASLYDFVAGCVMSDVVVAGEDFPVGVESDYYNPRQVGTDRLLNGLAAMHKIGRPVVVVDFGSCLTCDAISAQGALTAGAIAPGLPVIRAGLRSAVPHLQTSLDEATQLLGHGELPTGRSTTEGLVLGIVQALAATADRLVKTMRQTLGAEAPAVATGGDAAMIIPHCEVAMDVDEMLTLDGLSRAYESSRSRAGT